MEHLQRQQEAKMEMDLQEKHLRQAQLLFAQHAAAARAFGSRLDSTLFSKAADGETQQSAVSSRLSRIDPEAEKEDGDEDSDEDEEDMVEPEENDEVDEGEDDNRLLQQVKKPRLEHGVTFSRPALHLSTSPPSTIKQEPEENDEVDEEEDGRRLQQQVQKPRLEYGLTFSRPPLHLSTSPPSTVKQEPDEKERLSPGDHRAFTSPNGFADWAYDEPLKQVSSLYVDLKGALCNLMSYSSTLKSAIPSFVLCVCVDASSPSSSRSC